MQALPRRQQEVLQATVRHYVDTTEPVGSQILVKRFGLQASPATVRSAMGALEQRGLLTQPHTSAGRVPSQQGYRHYVDWLLPAPGAGATQLARELGHLGLQWASLDDLLQHLSRRLADLTGLLSLITRPQRPQRELQALRLVPSGDRLLVFLVLDTAGTDSLNLRLPATALPQIKALEHWATAQLEAPMGGGLDWTHLPPQLRQSGELLRQGLASHHRAQARAQEGAVALGLDGLLRQPEFSRSDSLRPLLQLVEDDPHGLLRSEAAAGHGGVWIGAEHPHPSLQHCAVVQATYATGSGAVGQVALVGPMRMAYATTLAAVRTVAASLERLLG